MYIRGYNPDIMSIEHIKISRGIRTGKPHLKGTRITVSDIVIWHLRMGKSRQCSCCDGLLL